MERAGLALPKGLEEESRWQRTPASHLTTIRTG